ncbi:Exodeoxyribonuclease 7 small subunit [Botrimarina colliarenosi]|uniref:Exodeoxyribonuclease 7 small subunit n=1 Tax=Botrimarina colliarenosi TaxID=2528001 RepID=A0A5C6AKH5_9BACT|nr:exodeoxyribonuclease VII small subunit [Botrimarina colliarenosi]TWT99758.1 Exodeoxyribonuclease 7 small subunit [Botrimarina colliarenosi]
MAKKKVKSAAPDAEPLEASLGELEAIVADLEGGELGLSDALARYEEGVRRLKQCHAQLQAAERRIELLSGVDADGNPVTTPFDDRATADEEGSAARSRKRTAGKGPAGEGFATDSSGDVDDRPRLF